MSERQTFSTEEKLRLLGYPPDAHLVIFNGDDLGVCHAANVGTFRAMQQGLVTSASLMAPCPWAYDACAYIRSHPDLDVGVHLTFTSEWQTYRWGPVLGRDACPSLVDGLGFFPRTAAEVWAAAVPEEIAAEADAQIRRAQAFGLDPSHLDGHMSTVYADSRFLEVYTTLARRYRLPLRMLPRHHYEDRGHADVYDAVDLGGILTIDDERWVALENPPLLEEQVIEYLRTLAPGISEIGLHAAMPTPEAEAIMNDWEARVEALRIMTESAAIRDEIRRRDIVLIGWRALRAAQRQLPQPAAP